MTDDRLLTPEEAAKILGVTPRWLQRHHRKFRFTRQLSRKVLRYQESGLREYVAKGR